MLVRLAAIFECLACIEYTLLIASECVRIVFVIIFNSSDLLAELLKVLLAILKSMLVETRVPINWQCYYVVLTAWRL